MIKLTDLPNDMTNYISKFIKKKVLKSHIINDLLANISSNNNYSFWNGLNYNINAIDFL